MKNVKHGRSAARARAGFSLMELIVSISIMSVLAGVVVPVMSNKIAASRDARRLTDLKAMVTAVEGYLLDKGTLPMHDAEGGYGGWDTTLDNQMVSVLVTDRYLREPVRDPKNDATYHYRYYKYNSGYEGFTSNFYVLGVKSWETAGYANTRGAWLGTARNWSNEFAYVTGGTER